MTDCSVIVTRTKTYIFLYLNWRSRIHITTLLVKLNSTEDKMWSNFTLIYLPPEHNLTRNHVSNCVRIILEIDNARKFSFVHLL